MKPLKYIFLVAVATVFILACSTSSDEENAGVNDTFDRSTLLANIADSIAIPALTDLDAKLTNLQSNTNTFVLSANQANLDAVRASWLEAYKVWQHVEMFNIGLAEETLYSFKMNIYPTTVADIEANIASGTYDLSNVNNNDAVGFPALDYMLFGIENNDAAILEKYNSNNYKNYLKDNVDQMVSLTQMILNDWTTSYRDTFVSQSGNTVTSALNKFTNDYIFYYEKGLRANKIGIPAGVFSAPKQTVDSLSEEPVKLKPLKPLPEKVEGLYSKVYSKTLLLEGLQAVKNVFNGNAYQSGTAGIGFNTYLEALEANELATVINARYDNAETVINNLNPDFGVQINTDINTDNTLMAQTFGALQLAVVSLKVDMLQVLNIPVDFVDADGD